MIRRPPRSTLFPSRRSSDLLKGARYRNWTRLFQRSLLLAGRWPFPERRSSNNYGLSFDKPASVKWLRSEEHTSELQSQSNLVCRLLLEKKKRKTMKMNETYW